MDKTSVLLPNYDAKNYFSACGTKTKNNKSLAD